jgi:hypothetical protein
VFRLFAKKKKKRAAPEVDPIAIFDGLLEALDRQGREVRRSAATLLALRAQLDRDAMRYRAQVRDLEGRLELSQGDARASRPLGDDLQQVKGALEQTLEASARAESDATLLLETAEALKVKNAELAVERQSAWARLAAGAVVSQALQQRVEEFDRVLRLDAARDEVERAHALAELLREEAAKVR